MSIPMYNKSLGRWSLGAQFTHFTDFAAINVADRIARNNVPVQANQLQNACWNSIRHATILERLKLKYPGRTSIVRHQ